MIREETKELNLCMAKNRPSVCIIQKNLCCATCSDRETCIEIYESKKGGVKPCGAEMVCIGDEENQCPFLEQI